MSDLNIRLRITERREEARDCLSLFFEKPHGFTYQPGDWMDIRFPTPEFPVGKTYSFASAPTEPDLRITFKKGVSPFKQRLEGAQLGETMLITQYGSNGFVFDRRYPAVFIAGGVGITPFRSMLKELVDTGSRARIEMVYQNRTADFPFRAELDAWVRACPTFTTHYLASESAGRLTRASLRRLLPGIANRQPKTYVAGPPGMVDRTVALLRALGVGEEDINTDHFTGY